MKRAPRLPSAEPLEARIAPATFTFNDTDGAAVTITTNKGTDADLAQVCKLTAEGSGFELQEIRFSELPTIFEGTNLTVLKGTADDAAVVNVGYINATGVSLGKVMIDGDLGQIDAGRTTPGTVNNQPVQLGTTAVGALSIGSLGVQGLNTQGAGASLDSVLIGKLGSLTIKSDVKDAMLTVYGAFPDTDTTVSDRFDFRGSIGNITIGGSLIGGSSTRAGSILAKGEIGDVRVTGSILGGPADESGSIVSEREIGKVKIGGDLKGGILTGPGTSDRAGRVFSGGLMGSVKIVGQLIGGDGMESGNVSSATGLGALTIGGIIGGAGEKSGAVGTGGNIGKIIVLGDMLGSTGNFSALIAAEGSIASARIEGSVKGGSGYQSGAIGSFKPLGAVTITGDIIGGGGQLSGVIVSSTTIKSVSVLRSIIGGGGEESGAIGSGTVLGPVSVGLSIIGGGGLRSGAVIAGANATKVTVGESVIAGTGPESGTIYSYGDLGTITVANHLTGIPSSGIGGDDAGSINSGGKIKSVTIRGSIIGGDGTSSGTVQSTLDMGPVSVGSDVQGGAGIFSGGIISGGRIARVTIGGMVMGGDGDNSGIIETDGDGEAGNMGPVSIGGRLVGGEGIDSGIVFSSGTLASLTVRSVLGGTGAGSGSVSSDLDMGAVTVTEDVQGSAAPEAGKISTAGRLASITIKGSLIGDDGAFDTTLMDSGALGQIYSADAMGPVKILGDVRGGSGAYGGHIRGASIKSVNIGGDLSGDGPATASIIAEETDLGAVTIGGTYLAAPSNPPSQISAQRNIASVTVGDLRGSSDGSGRISAGMNIGRLTIIGSSEYFSILAGYDVDLNPLTSAANIGPVIVGTTGAGNWTATNLVAGVLTGAILDSGINDGFFGTADDALISAENAVASRITSVVIKGTVMSTPQSDHFGLVASKISSVKIGGTVLPLTSGKDVIEVSAGGTPTDLTVREV